MFTLLDYIRMYAIKRVNAVVNPRTNGQEAQTDTHTHTHTSVNAANSIAWLFTRWSQMLVVMTSLTTSLNDKIKHPKLQIYESHALQ